MLFNSHFFIFIFLPISIFGYFFLHKLKYPQYAGCFLVAMSLWFYAANDVRSVPILLASIILNYYLGKFILKSDSEKTKKILCIIGVIINLGMLGVFKYLNFFMSNVYMLFGQAYSPISMLLPLGISFFTFQQISYLIDCKNNGASEYSLWEYAVFASFFPYVTSGPIAFHSEIIPQMRLKKNFKPSACNLSRGLTAFAFGLFKKVVIADTFGLAVSYGWSNVDSLNATSAIIVILSYTLQLYFDFSGYSDMASGIALCFNINLPINFDSPYKARNIAEFWKRWHMTMTRFFTRYVYIPLGGSRKGLARTCLNTMIIFLISGLWHGANWTFILWGGLHGVAMVIYRLISSKTDKHLPYPIGWFFTFIFVNICWVFFRATGIHSAFSMLKRLTSGFGSIPSALYQCFMTTETKIFDALLSVNNVNSSVIGYVSCVIFIIFALIIALFPKNIQRLLQDFKPSVPLCIATAFIFFWSVISISGISTFLYFTF